MVLNYNKEKRLDSQDSLIRIPVNSLILSRYLIRSQRPDIKLNPTKVYSEYMIIEEKSSAKEIILDQIP